jgi:hypothetical protein
MSGLQRGRPLPDGVVGLDASYAGGRAKYEAGRSTDHEIDEAVSASMVSEPGD